MSEVLMVMLLTAIACSILGPTLVLRRLSLTADALSHSVLLGIVLAFWLVNDLSSPILLIGAALFGLLMVLIVEYLAQRKLLAKDEALGYVFPLFFALAVIIISKFFRNAHIDVDVVLMGNPLFAPFVRWSIFPRSFVIMGFMVLINAFFIGIFYQPMLLATFDENEAKMQGIKTKLLYCVFMILTSLTCVAAFESVGAILVISFFVTPAASALLVAKKYYSAILYSLLFASIYVSIGYYIALAFNVSISGTVAFVEMIGFLLVCILHKGGLLEEKIRHYRQRKQLKEDLLLFHIAHHPFDFELVGYENIPKHMKWSIEECQKVLGFLLKKGYIKENKTLQLYEITSKGQQHIIALRK